MKFFQCSTQSELYGVCSFACELRYFKIFISKVTGVEFQCGGQQGHGSLLLENTAGPKAMYIMNKMFEMRQKQADILANNPELTVGDVTSINLTIMQGGVQVNVIPPEFNLSFDIRMAINVDFELFEKQVCGT